MDISIVIPNYNGENLLKTNLHKVFLEAEKYKKGKIEIIVVDDSSSDNSTEILKEFLKEKKISDLIINEKNKGFSSTVNRGVSAAKGEIIILFNTDVRPENGFLEPLLDHFADESVFAVGCLDKSSEEGGTELRGRGLGKWQRGFLIHRKGEVDKTNTLWVSGGSGAFRKSIWNKLGGLNELYNPFYYEDIDISYRAVKSGYKIFFEPKSVVVHEHEKGSIKNKYSGKMVKTIAYRNQFIFVWENATDFSLQITHVLWLPYHLIKAIFSFDTAFLVGFLKALYLLPKVIQSSLKAQRLFILSDKEVIEKANS